ncbi:CDN_1a_G0048340.mRNA.1.CDS.1 [Saccharomyces cerevisiae]|nr:Pex15p [Saccharomyces cerevisiae YJM450]AJT79243.1 Pex15p [Saccharomyces cerevisiae YJM555]AJU08071.1 Pex15p [Saccharomyces cerevisiae YJM1444]CAI4767755.1 CCC_1a_G0048410.mRNA.1.CDS.1 [Saccharomyces cerevisiae]CAI4771677.1 AEG_G0049040.mRNA.1.CDS.1 [Saccharomyces cerevisiae]
MAASEIMNNLPMHSLDSSLRDLLNDDLFIESDESTKSVNDQRSEVFQECVNLFIKRDIKDCLEKMSEVGFIDITVFKSNPMILDLFVSACDIMPSFTKLGLTLQGEILNIFTLDTPQCIETRKIILGDLSKLLVINKFFRCCIKVIQVNLTDHTEQEEKTLELESIMSDFIFVYITKMRTTIDVVGLQELIEIFIFQVKVKLHHKKPSPNMYWALCKTLPKLSPTLKGLYLSKDVSIEDAILNSIDNKIQKDKAKSKGKQRGVKQKIHHFHEPMLHNSSEEQVKVEDAFNQRTSTDSRLQSTGTAPRKKNNDITVLAGSFWAVLKHHFTRSVLNKNGLLLTGLLLLLCLKKYKSLMAIFKHVPAAFHTVYPQIVGLLKLLASI